MSKIKIGLLSIVVISNIAFGATDCSHCANLPMGQDSECLNKCYAQSSSSGTSASSSGTTTNTATNTSGLGNTVNQVTEGIGNFVGTVQNGIKFIQNVTKAYQDLKFESSKIAKYLKDGVNIASGLVNEANLQGILGTFGLKKLNFKELNLSKIGADKAFCKIDKLITEGDDALKILEKGKKEAEQFLKANFYSFNKNNKQSWDIAGLVDKAMGCKDDQANAKEINDIAKAKKEILIKNEESRKAINRLTHYGDASTKNFLNFLFDNGFVEINEKSELGNIIKDIDSKLSEKNIGKEQATKLKFTKNGGFSSQDNIVKAKADFTEIHIEMQKTARKECKNQDGIHDYEYCVKAAKQKLTSQCLESKNSSNSNGNRDNPNTPNGLPAEQPNDNQSQHFTDLSTEDSGKCAGYFIEIKNDSDKQKAILTSFAKDLMKDVKTSEEINKMALTDSDKLIEKQKSMQKLKEAEKQLTMMNNLYGMIDEVNNLQLTHAFVSAEPFDEAFSREKIDKITKQAEAIAEGMIQALTTKIESR